MLVLKPFTVPLGANGPLLGEETDLSVFAEMQLPDLPGMPQLEKKSEQMSVLQAINNNQQMLQALADQLHMAGKHRAVGSGHGTSLCLSTATASHLDPVFPRLHAKLFQPQDAKMTAALREELGYQSYGESLHHSTICLGSEKESITQVGSLQTCITINHSLHAKAQVWIKHRNSY